MQASDSGSAASGPSAADIELVRRVAAGDHNWAVIATGRRNGSVQATIVDGGRDESSAGRPADGRVRGARRHGEAAQPAP